MWNLKIVSSKDTNILNIYLRDINRFPFLTDDEALACWKNIRANPDSLDAQKDKNKLIRSWLRYVVKIAKKHVYKDKDLELVDLIQMGNFGLMDAVNRFDLNRGVKFKTYAEYRINGAIVDGLRNSAHIKGRRLSTINKASHLRDEIETIYGSVPTNKELAEYLNMSEDEVRQLFIDKFNLINIARLNELEYDSLKHPYINVEQEFFDKEYVPTAEELREEAIIEAIDRILTENQKQRLSYDRSIRYTAENIACNYFALQNKLLNKELENEALDEIFKQDKLTFCALFGFDGKAGITMREIALKFGVTEPNIHRLNKNALKKLRIYLNTAEKINKESLIEAVKLLKEKQRKVFCLYTGLDIDQP